eukprot:1524705-Amphidinium_carterae.1
MGPRVLGFSYPGHRFPPRPVQPGLGTIGQVKPKSVVAMRSRFPSPVLLRLPGAPVFRRVG